MRNRNFNKLIKINVSPFIIPPNPESWWRFKLTDLIVVLLAAVTLYVAYFLGSSEKSQQDQIKQLSNLDSLNSKQLERLTSMYEKSQLQLARLAEIKDSTHISIEQLIRLNEKSQRQIGELTSVVENTRKQLQGINTMVAKIYLDSLSIFRADSMIFYTQVKYTGFADAGFGMYFNNAWDKDYAAYKTDSLVSLQLNTFESFLRTNTYVKSDLRLIRFLQAYTHMLGQCHNQLQIYNKYEVVEKFRNFCPNAPKMLFANDVSELEGAIPFLQNSTP